MTPRKPRSPKADATAAPGEVKDASTPLFVINIDVRWRDLDAFNHVNNATYLTYLEEARLQWLRHVPGTWFDEHAMPVLAASELSYRRPIAWPGRLAVELYVKRVGRSSLTLGHRMLDAVSEGVLYSEGHVVMVWTDPQTGRSVDLPSAIRECVG